ncbi:oxidoreductase NAD-binding domain-containing protein 1 [Micropterus dolomieu]|uniref:oxidoreductase NAD-binding domain-containing protein 1 n=1 Tax=Micropterus dolomieu TaxID=147949 RepID=UPI001E8E5B24|nr:oxidoreductase NAD-binding domain-containing protein 1 [Micropterus dolomieu]XP_045913690.1 oxidoreductase NAD-binding domain-containing protein 1 [Micropterus dolomieu]XP_045913691.1 oxidoreductase NAD-binding domain-containing protein 1 [Micropterus dolomieu]
MSVPCFLSSVARSFCPPAGLLCCRILGPSSFTRRRNMSSRRQMDHLQRTANNSRQNVLYPAKVCGIINESEMVKRLRIAVHPDFTFKAGQWVDFFIPGVEKVGGFSMCSSPGLLQREGIVELAVKYTKHPPALWVHTTCTVGARVAMRVGGDFFFDLSPSDPSVDLLLVAGGVGINPLYSILLHTTDLLRLNCASGGRDYNIGSVHLCYSAKNTQELLFKSSIIEACRDFPDKFSCDFHVTQQCTDVDPHLQPFLKCGRITEDELHAHVDLQRTLCFLCGPPPMIEAISKTLMDFGLPKDRILFEKWW